MAMSRGRKIALIILGVVVALVLVAVLGIALLFAAFRKSGAFCIGGNCFGVLFLRREQVAQVIKNNC